METYYTGYEHQNVSYSIWAFDDAIWQFAFASQQKHFYIKWKLFHELLCAMLGIAFCEPHGIAVRRCVDVLFACRQSRLDGTDASRLHTYSVQPSWEKLESSRCLRLRNCRWTKCFCGWFWLNEYTGVRSLGCGGPPPTASKLKCLMHTVAIRTVVHME